MKKVFCIRGHNLSIVGQRKDRHCSECNRENARKYAVQHRDKILQKNKQYYQTHKIESRKYTLDYLYGLTLDEYQIMFRNQNGQCAICHIHQDKLKKNLMVDHDHKFNKVRGLLCSKCNLLLGNSQDSIITLQNAIQYLTRDQLS